MNKRALGEKMFKSFLDGELRPLLEEVKKDDTLDLEFRGESHAIIYYRGGKLCDIQDEKIEFNKAYIKYIPEVLRVENDNRFNVSDKVAVIKEIPFYKRGIDYRMNKKIDDDIEENDEQNKKWKKKTAYEREFQQVVVRENNRHHEISHDSDYYITDMEYQIGDEYRFDLIAVKWVSTPSARQGRSVGRVPSLSIIEMKYGDNALKGSSGICSHLKDMCTFIKSADIHEFCKDVETIFEQKCKLGLIPDMKEKPHEISNISSRPLEVVFLIGNHKPAKTTLCTEIENIKSSEYNFDIKFARASLMGYCLYDSMMLTPEECVKFLQETK